MIHGAAIGNRDQVLQSSIKLGFLTGYEDKVECCLLEIYHVNCYGSHLQCVCVCFVRGVCVCVWCVCCVCVCVWCVCVCFVCVLYGCVCVVCVCAVWVCVLCACCVCVCVRAVCVCVCARVRVHV